MSFSGIFYLRIQCYCSYVSCRIRHSRGVRCVASQCVLFGRCIHPIILRTVIRYDRRVPRLCRRHGLVDLVVNHFWVLEKPIDVNFLSSPAGIGPSRLSPIRYDAAGQHVPTRPSKEHFVQYIRNLRCDWVLFGYIYVRSRCGLYYLAMVLLDRCHPDRCHDSLIVLLYSV